MSLYGNNESQVSNPMTLNSLCICTWDAEYVRTGERYFLNAKDVLGIVSASNSYK